MKAIWNNTVLADSPEVIELEGHVYFPPQAVRREYLRPAPNRSECAWKGTAHYYDIVTPQGENPAAAWYYPDPRPAAAAIRNYIAFWRGVRVVADG